MRYKKIKAEIVAVTLVVGLLFTCHRDSLNAFANNEREETANIETINGLNHKVVYLKKKKSSVWSLSKLKKAIKTGKNVKGKVVKVKIKDVTSIYDFYADNETCFVYYHNYEIPEIVQGDTVYAKVKMTQKLKLDNGETEWVVAYVLANGYENPDLVYVSR